MLRVIFYIYFNEGKELRRALRNLRKTLPDILNVFALFFLSLVIFAFIGWKLLNKRNLVYSNGQEYFTNFFDSIWDLYISVTTANFPDVM
jgi:two pore calcium channel protein 3